MKLLKEYPSDIRVTYCMWSRKVDPAWIQSRATFQGVMSSYRPYGLNPAPQYVSLKWLLDLEWDEKVLWSPVWGSLPFVGSCGLTYPRLEVVLEGTDYFRWLIIGQQALIDGRFVMVFEDSDKGLDGNYHFNKPNEGIYRLVSDPLRST